MTTWLDVLDESQGIRAIFGDDLPTLRSISLHELCLHRDGPRAVLRFDLSQFPQAPPRKWSSQGFNTVQLQLMLVDVQDVSVTAWSNESVVDLSLESAGEFVVATTVSGPARITIRARTATVTSISAYQNGDVVS